VIVVINGVEWHLNDARHFALHSQLVATFGHKRYQELCKEGLALAMKLPADKVLRLEITKSGWQFSSADKKPGA
jgi:hypothetical protein